MLWPIFAIATLLSLDVRAQPRADDAFRRTVRQDRDLVVKMSSLIGPDAAAT